MVRCKGRKLAKQNGLKKVIDESLDWLMQPKIRHKIASEIRDTKSRVIEVHERHRRYDISNLSVDKPVITVDPRLFTQYTEVKELVGIDDPRDELINKIMIQENGVNMKQGKILSIVGFGGLGKTTLANAVYKKIKVQFDCCAFVSVSQTPDLKKLYKGLLYDLGNNINEETLGEKQLIDILKEFLQNKRYFVVVDDIWDVSVWEKIRCALPDNDVGYNIIITTRISDVAEKAGGAYKLEPLSLNKSRKLLYSRIFGNENKDNSENIAEKCPDEELAEVSDKILKKCAGVPLAIITMATLLACKARNKMEWYEVYNSVGTGLENNLDMENMRKILSFSYYELPCYLRTCFLYFSMFPEDFVIDKDRLIRMWIAEGFIQCEKPGKSLYELGEGYFNELINRSMIQPSSLFYGMVSGCRVHDMVLDLMCSLSREENFVTILHDLDHPSPSNKFRRLSLQDGKEHHAVAQATTSLQHARSVVVFQSAVALAPALGSFKVLRVLDLDECDLSLANNGLKYLGNLYHLRYLGLHRTGISQLPEEIGNLQFLQTLDAKGNHISSLPSTTVQLRNLMFLYIDSKTRVPNGIGNLTCLEQLSCLCIDDSTINIIEELGQLTELRVLNILLYEWYGKLLEGLRKLQKIRKLVIMVAIDDRSNGGLDGWVAPQHLRELYTQGSCLFSTLPAWMNQSLLQDLTSLCITVGEVHQIHLEILGRLPALCSLNLAVDNKNLGILRGFVIGAGSFLCLAHCEFQGFVWPVVFQQGAMPRVIELWLQPLYVLEMRESASSLGCLDLGLGNLPSLQDICITLQYDGASKEAEEKAELAALMHAAEIHPNHPQYWIDDADYFSSD